MLDESDDITVRLDDGVDTFAAAPDAIVVVDDMGLIATVNNQASELFGYTRDELVGRPIEVLLPERFGDTHVAHRQAYTARPTRRAMGQTLSLFGRRKNGEEFAVDVSLNYEQNDARGLRVIAFVRDATARRRIEEELRTSEEGFRLLVEGAADHAIFMLDPSGRVVTWNPGAERIKAWRADEILGRHFSVFYPPDDVASGQPERDLEHAAADGRAQSDGWRVRANGQRFWAETTLSAVRDEAGTLRGYVKVTRDRTENHHAGETFGVLGVLMARGREPLQTHEADMLQAFAMQAAASFAHARDRREVEQLRVVSERERIARDLHDTVIQRLFAVGMSLQATGRRPPAETQERLSRAVADIDDTIRSIRTSIFSLEASAAKPGLRSRVLDIVAEVTPVLAFEPSVQFDGPVETLATPEVAEHLVAILREALANVARHAHATAASVTVSAGDDIVLIVDDDGVGAPVFHREGGHGVANLHERAQILGGNASIAARAPRGTRVEWRVPTPG